MGKIKFKNGTEFETIEVHGYGMTFQNANRDTLEIRIAEDKATYDDLKAIYKDAEALSEIEIKDIVDVPSENGEIKKTEVQSLNLYYEIPVELALREINGASVWCMKVAQKSAIEIAQAKQAADIDDTQKALMELAEIIAGGDV